MSKDMLFALLKSAGPEHIGDVFKDHFPTELSAGHADCIMCEGNPVLAKNPHMHSYYSKIVSPQAMAWNYGWNSCWQDRYYSNQRDDPQPYAPSIQAQTM